MSIIQKRLCKVPKVVEGPPHMYLKELEVIVFMGHPMETKFVACLIKSAIKLEKIVIHTRLLDFLHLKISHSKEFNENTRRMVHELAHQLMENRLEAELVLL
ncbi:hypothetical protein HRI_001600700 [Hibiscus trionum]|uniref:FBD domain-containing protein n=1 Tax=Hibiscus trionum TaxID=183268 RepID=A0A9W7HL09_HIBTR|nr:hypothetical protein HRI_001600700 [Hibiscus trionum]